MAVAKQHAIARLQILFDRRKVRNSLRVPVVLSMFSRKGGAMSFKYALRYHQSQLKMHLSHYQKMAKSLPHTILDDLREIKIPIFYKSCAEIRASVTTRSPLPIIDQMADYSNLLYEVGDKFPYRRVRRLSRRASC